MHSEGEARRFCDVCTKQVHDLSSMTEAAAREVLDVEFAKGRVCVRYKSDRAGNIKFVQPPIQTTPAPGIWRATLAAAGMTLMMMTGCADNQPDQVNTDHCVYEVGPWSFTAARGEGTCPPEAEPEHELLGKIAIEPDPEPEAVLGEAPMLEPEPMVQGEIAEPDPEPEELTVKGDVAAPEPEPVKKGKVKRPEPAEEEFMMGDLAYMPEDEPDAEPCADPKPHI